MHYAVFVISIIVYACLISFDHSVQWIVCVVSNSYVYCYMWDSWRTN